ncbi:hypothetical protein GCK32_003808 [Trichostrongylus colubriformis]|uniref:Uncharacterized protein n=1 Tax=Trichostrongylus colubriformis TaxID=6319 RepID=A0AAN8IEC9_TRICO
MRWFSICGADLIEADRESLLIEDVDIISENNSLDFYFLFIKYSFAESII